MSKKKRLYLSVLIPVCLFMAMVLIGIVYMLIINPYVGSQDRCMGEPPKEAYTYSLAFHFLEELFSWRNFVRLTAFSVALSFALWYLLAKRRNRDTSLAFLTFFSGFGVLLSVVPLLFALLVPVSDTVAFAVFGLAEFLEEVIYPLARILLFVVAIIFVRLLLSFRRDGTIASS